MLKTYKTETDLKAAHAERIFVGYALDYLLGEVPDRELPFILDVPRFLRRRRYQDAEQAFRNLRVEFSEDFEQEFLSLVKSLSDLETREDERRSQQGENHEQA